MESILLGLKLTQWLWFYSFKNILYIIAVCYKVEENHQYDALNTDSHAVNSVGLPIINALNISL